MSDQPPRNIYNEQPNQGAQGMFNASATSHYRDPRQQRQIDYTERSIALRLPMTSPAKAVRSDPHNKDGDAP